MTASRGIRLTPQIAWTPEEDAVLLENISALGQRGLAASGLLPGRSRMAIQGRYKVLRGVKHTERNASKPLRPVPQFDRQHVSVWGYARSVGATA